jgi:hypothetical protein
MVKLLALVLEVAQELVVRAQELVVRAQELVRAQVLLELAQVRQELAQVLLLVQVLLARPLQVVSE